MKKFICVFLCVVLTLGLGSLLVGCDNPDGTTCTCGDIKGCQCGDTNECQCEPDQLYADFLADKDVGYELPVYPNFEFDYRGQDSSSRREEYQIHINEIKVILKSKNIITPNEIYYYPSSLYYYPYTYEITVDGVVSWGLLPEDGLSIIIWGRNAQGFTVDTTIQKDGSFQGSTIWNADDTSLFQFRGAFVSR